MISKFKRRLNNMTLLKNTENYIYISPHKLLRPYVAHYTISFAGDSVVSDTLTLIPDASGCLVFSFDGNTLQSDLFGASTKTIVVKNDVNDCPMRLFIEFLPGGLSYFSGAKQSDLTDARLPLTQINHPLNSLVVEAFEKAKNLDDFIEMLDFILLPYVVGKTPAPTLLSAMECLKGSYGMMPVKELSSAVYYSERHLNRIFHDYIGLSVKTFSRLIRINTAIKRMQNPRTTLTGIAQQTGFYDQAHFINDFKSICDVSPQYYLKYLSDFYNEPFKL